MVKKLSRNVHAYYTTHYRNDDDEKKMIDECKACRGRAITTNLHTMRSFLENIDRLVSKHDVKNHHIYINPYVVCVCESVGCSESDASIVW